MSGKRWTARERAYLCRHYRKKPATEIARVLGRTVSMVYNAAWLFGLHQPRPVFTAQMQETLRHLHSQGMTDVQIAQDMELDRRWVRDRRAMLGLPVNVAAVRQAHQRGLQTQRERLGIRPGGELRALGYRRYAHVHGWPEDLPPRAVQILDLLWTEGPQTRKEIAAALGLPWRGVRNSLKSRGPGGTYLTQLIARGLVICLPRLHRVIGQGSGRSCHVYALSITAQKREVHATG